MLRKYQKRILNIRSNGEFRKEKILKKENRERFDIDQSTNFVRSVM